MNVCIVSPAWQRFAVTRLALTQRARLCEQLATRGVDAAMVIVADDENLDIAREHGAITVEAPNKPLGRKCNTGLRAAADHGADWIVWVGSDDWIHADVFAPLLKDPEAVAGQIMHGHRLGVVDLAAGRMRRCSSPSLYGAIPWIIPRKTLERANFEPVPDRSNRGLDGALVRGVRKSRASLAWHVHNPHDLRCVDFKSATNITSFERLTKNLSIAPTEDAWPALAEHYDADLVDLARQTHLELVEAAACPS